MDKYTIITPKYLRKRLCYQPEAGKLFWRMVTPCERLTEKACKIINKKYAGKEAATATNSWGYKITVIQKHGFLAHRIVWAMHYGEWPVDEIDHIDGNKQNNCISNLRTVEGIENRKNMPKQRNNTSGCVGVDLKGKKWQARIGAGGKGKRLDLGTFETFDEAVAARKKAEIEYGFHKNHGRP